VSNGDFYARQPSVHLDGTLIFKTAEDDANESEVARLIEAAWGCTLHSFGRLAPIDWYAVREDRFVGLLELKARSHEYGTFPTVFLNVRKWLTLMLASVGLGVPALFVVRFTDGVRWVPLSEIDATKFTIAGCGIVKYRGDVEPIIEVQVESLRPLLPSQEQR